MWGKRDALLQSRATLLLAVTWMSVVGSVGTARVSYADEKRSADEKGKRPARQIEVLSKTTVFTLGETIPITFRFTNHGKTPWELLEPEPSPHVQIWGESGASPRNAVFGFSLERSRAIRTVDSNGVVMIAIAVEEVPSIVIDPGKSHKFTYVFKSWRYPSWRPGRIWVFVKFKPGRNAKVMETEKLPFDVVQTARSVPILINFAKDEKLFIEHRKWAGRHLSSINSVPNFNWPRYNATLPEIAKTEKQNQQALREFEAFWKLAKGKDSTKQTLRKINEKYGVDRKLFEAHQSHDLQRTEDEQQRKQGRKAPSK